MRPAFTASRTSTLRRFPLTIVGAILVVALVIVAKTGRLDVIRLPAWFTQVVDPRAADDIAVGLILLTAAVVVDLNRTRRLAAIQAQRDFTSLFLANPLPMWIYDTSTLCVLEVNATAIATYGYEREAFLRMTIKDLRPAEDVERLLEQISAGGTGRSWRPSGSWRHRLQSGAIIDVDLTSRALVFAGREAVLVVAQDVTERKRLERQFQQAQKMDAIGQLAGGVAHDFNNLLTIILGFCGILLNQHPVDDPERQDLEEIHKAGTNAVWLTRQLLAFSRKELIQPQVIDLNAEITETTKMLQRLVGEDVEIELHLAPALSNVRSDPGQVNQLLVNLVVNARDAMPSGGKLTIETDDVVLDASFAESHFSIVPGPHVMLAVSDTGTGMTQDVQAHLFEPFFTTKAPGKGTGLGLASVYGIVKQNDGSIWVYSEVGQGTTFKIYLPAVAMAAQAVAARTSTTGHTGAASILVVEDHPGLRAFTSKVLRAHGYTVALADNGAHAVEIWQAQGPFDLLLTDVVMPGQSGARLAEQLLAQQPELRVLYVSGYASDAIVRHGVLEGSMAFLPKPFSPEALLGKVREVLTSASPK